MRAGYDLAARTRETVAEVGEQFQDVLAEVRAEREQEPEAEWRSAPEHEHHTGAAAAETTSERAAEPDRTKGKKSKSSTEPAET